MLDLIVTRDLDDPSLVKGWRPERNPTLNFGAFESSGSRHLHSFGIFCDGTIYPELKPGHSARLVLQDVTDHRPVPAIEWVTVGCLDTATLNGLSAFVRPEDTYYFLGAINNGHKEIGDRSSLKTRAEARTWCEAELRKAVAR